LHTDTLVNNQQSRQGWNSHHPHNTRFRRKILANLAPLDSQPSFHTPASHATAFIAKQQIMQQDDTEAPLELKPFSFLDADSNDVMHYGQMLKDPDHAKFEDNMTAEIDGLFAHDTISIIPAPTLPPDSKPLSAIWSFCKKRLPYWTIVKWKARLCPHGGQQIQGVNFWHTYAPVVK
jgi:hypothetical protein